MKSIRVDLRLCSKEEAEEFINEDLPLYVASYVDYDLYHILSDESKTKFKRKKAVMSLRKFAPRRRFGISKDDIEDYVGELVERFYHEWLQDNPDAT